MAKDSQRLEQEFIATARENTEKIGRKGGKFRKFGRFFADHFLFSPRDSAKSAATSEIAEGQIFADCTDSSTPFDGRI